MRRVLDRQRGEPQVKAGQLRREALLEENDDIGLRLVAGQRLLPAEFHLHPVDVALHEGVRRRQRGRAPIAEKRSGWVVVNFLHEGREVVGVSILEGVLQRPRNGIGH